MDFTKDLEHFRNKYPEDLLIYFDGDTPRGFLAFQDWFRTDPWGAVESGANDAEVLNALITGLERIVSSDFLRFHYHTSFERLTPIFLNRDYRVEDHKTCMILGEKTGTWPHTSDELFIRPWWT